MAMLSSGRCPRCVGALADGGAEDPCRSQHMVLNAHVLYVFACYSLMKCYWLPPGAVAWRLDAALVV